jgi:hypothetical protein
LTLIRKDDQALVTMVATTMVVIADPDGGFSDKANTKFKGVSQET